MKYRMIFPTLVIASLLATAAPVLSETMVKDVVVKTDISAIQNPKAAAHYATLTDDLKNAIVARLIGRTADDGVKISVDIDSVELANSFQSAAGIAESKLIGHVNVSHENDNSKFDTYDEVVSFQQAGPFFLPGTDLTKITTDSKEYYDAMIAAFADGVVARLD